MSKKRMLSSSKTVSQNRKKEKTRMDAFMNKAIQGGLRSLRDLEVYKDWFRFQDFRMRRAVFLLNSVPKSS